MRAVVESRLVSILSRLLLGLVFVYASYHKILDPPGFAKIVWGYKILPSELVNVWALYLPWVELVTGLALIVGVFRRGAAVVIAGLLVMFLVAIGINLARGIPFDCGCFSHAAAPADPPPVIGPVVEFLFTSSDPWVTFWRDVVLLLMAAVTYWSPVNWLKPRPPVEG